MTATHPILARMEASALIISTDTIANAQVAGQDQTAHWQKKVSFSA